MQPGLTYVLRNAVYVALTNRAVSVTLIESRGPGFVMPASAGFSPLPDGFEPSAAQACAAIDSRLGSAAEAGFALVVFGGVGDPLVRLPTLLEVARHVRQSGSVDDLRVTTAGLVAHEEQAGTAAALASAGVTSASVSLASSDAAQYAELMRPHSALGHEHVCAFVRQLVQTGMHVTCTAVAAPGVDEQAARALSESLGASDFKMRSHHP